MNKILKLTLLVFFLSASLVYADFTPPTENYTDDEYTELLIHGDQADGTAGTDILDSSHNNRTITAVGDAQVDTEFYKNLTGSTGSILFGEGNWLTLEDSADFDFSGGEDFTIDCWVYPLLTGSPASYKWIFNHQAGTDYVRFYSFRGDLRFNVYLVLNVDTVQVLLAETWQHVAIVKDGNDYTIYWNGIEKASTNTVAVCPNVSGLIEIGSEPTYTPFRDWLGSIDEFRISKGIARDWAPEVVGQVIFISRMKEWNPKLAKKIRRTTGRWNIKARMWWKNFYWDYLRG